jgi:hypothetical protein
MLQLQKYQRLLAPQSTKPIKVAILDTGVDLPDKTPKWIRKPRYESYSWTGVRVDESTQDQHPVMGQGDPDGHGTHMASIVLDIARNCKLYVVQIAGAMDDIHGEEAKDATASAIAKVSS